MFKAGFEIPAQYSPWLNYADKAYTIVDLHQASQINIYAALSFWSVSSGLNPSKEISPLTLQRATQPIPVEQPMDWFNITNNDS